MFLDMIFPLSSGVLSIHRKRDLPAGESRRRAIKRIGNETREATGKLDAEGGNEEALTTRVIAEELGKRGRKFAVTG
jgi:hypothetical protein